MNFYLLVLAACIFSINTTLANDMLPLTIGFFPDHIFTSSPEKAALYQEVLFFKQVGQTLVESGPTDELVPGLATKWTISSDKKKYTFKLDKGIKFHDGTELLAQDVVNSLNRAIYSEANTLRLFFINLKGFEEGYKKHTCPGIVATSNDTIQISLIKPYTPLLKVLTSGLTAVFKKNTSLNSTPLCGTGPYKIVNQGGNYLLEANQNYKGIYPPKIEKIKLVTSSDLLFGKKPLIASDLPDYDVFVPYGAKEIYNSANYTVTQTPHLATAGFYPNLKSAFSKKKENRLLILSLIYKTVHNMTAHLLNTTPGSSLTDLFPRGMLAHDSARNSWLQFRRTLENIQNEKKSPTVTIATIGPILGDTQHFLEAFSKISNVKINVVLLDTTQLLESIKNRHYDVLYLVWHSVISDPQAQIAAFELLGSFNYGEGSKNTQRLVDESVARSSESERAKVYNKIADNVFDEALFLPIYQRDHTTALKVGYRTSNFIYRYQPMFSEIQKQ